MNTSTNQVPSSTSYCVCTYIIFISKSGVAVLTIGQNTVHKIHAKSAMLITNIVSIYPTTLNLTYNSN